MPRNDRYLKGECQHCGGHIEFPVKAAGLTADCPHCGKQTELLLARPPEEPTAPHKGRIWAIAAIVILSLGLVAVLIALNRAQRWAARQKQQASASAAAAVAAAQTTNLPPPEDPWAKLGFKVSAIRLEKSPGSSLVYAVGTVVNLTDRQRFGVNVELDLLDAAGQKVGTATDYQQVIEPKGRWTFKGLVVGKKAVSARLAGIKEQQ